jgi:class 3 adenylate cyclase
VLRASGHDFSAAEVLSSALILERLGYLYIEREGGYRFGLTALGDEWLHHNGHGDAAPLTLVMADLAGFTSYTEVAGDHAARIVASAIHDAATDLVRSVGGRLVKALGDGVLASAPADVDAVELLRALAVRCARLGDADWQLRAAAHVGRPLAHQGDLFGADVNLVARLCDEAEAGEALVTSSAGRHLVSLRGIEQPVRVKRIRL